MIFGPAVPFQFFPPRFSRVIHALIQPYVRYRILPRVLAVDEISIEHADRARDLQRAGHSQVFVCNHPDHSDGWTIGRAMYLSGVGSYYLTDYANLVRGKRSMVALLRSVGMYSIDPYDIDHASFKASMAILTQYRRRRGVLLTPEGNINIQGDRVEPFKEGPFFMAVRAARELMRDQSGRGVWVTPVAIKFTHMTDARPELERLVSSLQLTLGVALAPLGENPVATLTALGLAAANSAMRRLGLDDLPPIRSIQRLGATVTAVLDRIEADLGADPGSQRSSADRIMLLRRRIRAMIGTGHDRAAVAAMEDRLNFAARLDSYALDYTCSHTTLDRVSELARKLHEDVHNDRARLHAPTRAIMRFCPPLDVAAYLARGPVKQAIAALTRDAHASVQQNLDDINAHNPAPGGRLWRDLARPSHSSSPVATVSTPSPSLSGVF